MPCRLLMLLVSYFEWFVFCELNWFGYALMSFKFQLCWSIKISWLMPSPEGTDAKLNRSRNV
jgi:hypothetical protein